MSTLVRYSKDGVNLEIDLAKLSPREYDLIKDLHLKIQRGDRALLCQQAPMNDEGAEMFIRLRGDRYWAVHFRGSACSQDHEIAEPESAEHRCQKDYWQRAAEDAGYRATQEYRTGRGTILDVAIDGPHRTGIEVQHSAIEPTKVKSRTTKSFGAGWLPVWFLDSDHTPPWFNAVPALGCNELLWSSMPRRRAATAIGPRAMEPIRCTYDEWGYCPVGGRRSKKARRVRPCGEWHPKTVHRRGLTVDDVAGMLPAGELVAMRDMLNDVRLTTPADLMLFQELTGLSGEYQPGRSDPARGQPAPRTTACFNTGHRNARTLRWCAKCGDRPAGPDRILCTSCRLIMANRSPSDFYPPPRATYQTPYQSPR